MSDRLGWRMLGAFWILNASNCAQLGLRKYPDNSGGRWFYSVVCVTLFFYLAYRAWGNELKS